MKRSLQWAPALLMLTTSAIAFAAPTSSWDGTWKGKWGNQNAQATSVTVVNNKVVSYEYQGVSTPVAESQATATMISYAGQGTTVTLKRTGSQTAFASLHAPQGEATAVLTRQ
jgi:hypothetical protein